MALRSDWSQRTCAMARGLDILGDPWSMLVLREVFFGNGRFDAMKKRLMVADSVLTKRLAGLVDDGRVLVRRTFPVAVPRGASTPTVGIGNADPATIFPLDTAVSIRRAVYDAAVKAGVGLEVDLVGV